MRDIILNIINFKNLIMKKKQLSRKLNLKKSTISNLNEVKGGAYGTKFICVSVNLNICHTKGGGVCKTDSQGCIPKTDPILCLYKPE